MQADRLLPLTVPRVGRQIVREAGYFGRSSVAGPRNTFGEVCLFRRLPSLNSTTQPGPPATVPIPAQRYTEPKAASVEKQPCVVGPVPFCASSHGSDPASAAGKVHPLDACMSLNEQPLQSHASTTLTSHHTWPFVSSFAHSQGEPAYLQTAARNTYSASRPPCRQLLHSALHPVPFCREAGLLGLHLRTWIVVSRECEQTPLPSSSFYPVNHAG